MKNHGEVSVLRRLLDRLIVVGGAVALSLAFFLVLPFMQAIGNRSDEKLLVRDVGAAEIPPPPPPPEQKPQEEPEPDEPDEPELEEEPRLLDLSQLEIALDDRIGDGLLEGDFAADIRSKISRGGDLDALFSMADLDQKPRVIYQPSPIWNEKMRRKAPGSVTLVFLVTPEGTVENPIVTESTDPVFERASLAAVKQWKFEPGKRNGDPVRFRMRVPILFPEG